MKMLQDTSMLDGGNIVYLEQQYESYLRDPNSVTESWRHYFERLPMVNGQARDIPHSEVRQHFYNITRNSAARRRGPVESSSAEHERKQIQVGSLIDAYRARGHQLADIDPLGRMEKIEIREVQLHECGLSGADLQTEFQTPALYGIDVATLSDIVAHLEKIYCGTIGYEYMYINHTTQKLWLQQRIESYWAQPDLSTESRQWILERLTASEGMEKYLHSRYVGQKRFSLEGGESLIVIMGALVQRASAAGCKELVIGMAHRGRLNVLVNVLGKNPAELFSEFEGKHDDELSSGDVKYHQGFSSDIKSETGEFMHLALAFNPSHLEIVSPVVEGSVRSRQDRYGDSQGENVIPVSIHGDAAFAGQGVVMETFNMADSRGFSTKGTIHIVVNNQVGFTTSNTADSRSTLYATDVAKMINAPIFHVNGDDPEAVLFVSQLALDFRNEFQKDVVIDLVCYRRHGHNEADEPSATQPMMYKTIKALPTTRQLYADALVAEGVIDVDYPQQLIDAYRDKLDAGLTVANGVAVDPEYMEKHHIAWADYINSDWRVSYESRLPVETLQKLANSLTTLPDGLALQSRVKKIIEDRRKMTAGAQPIDWGYAENLAYATLLHHGYPVRLSGQDCGRGTFFHRHAVLHNQNDGSTHVPLRNVFADQPNFLVIDSVLSEEAVLAFEYGYASADPTTMVIWEAQFGDFANGAQVVIDQFISSGETKWGRLCGISLFLPHGYEGQGPEHSSARLERFLQLCAEDNMQVCVPSTPAQAYHMIRRQMLRPIRRPLIVMTPKSLLRHRLAVSTLEDLADGTFEPVLGEIDQIDSSAVDRVVFCSGKVYYDLVQKRRETGQTNVAVVRVEQLYPFPYTEMQDVIARYPNARRIVWCQEEPRNQGAWRATRHRIERILREGQELEFSGRPPSASPAVGYANQHIKEQNLLVMEALALQENSQHTVA
ncbi:2-oxoglutarate dehydrogenase E1 component [Chromatiales bacterium (ex Bugula neritina AB1)]|nr:2-oxoglutarate dehydrogenase E1 component [Chromatiales bacterium (ex Bugula neritina AB1)]